MTAESSSVGCTGREAVNFSALLASRLDRSRDTHWRPKKNTIGSEQTACVDYRQSKRECGGDTTLYLLFTEDARVSVR